ncbi:MAG: right-handed parallel beta-helix repeat-containing protein [Desulfuromonadales bacterium]|nr:right-handed parallel beta-helix repeat-containing protein [Desulfuromonadales bacterium]
MKLLLLVVYLCLIPLPILAQDGSLSYRGENTLYRDTVWQGEVTIDGILTVAPGITLEIRPGTVVSFTFSDSNHDRIGEHELFIQGTLRAMGTAAAPVVFTSAQAQPHPGDWGAINMMATETESLFEHCKIEYAYRGFHAHFSRARLRDTELSNNLRAGQFQESTVAIERCKILDNFNGIQFRDSTVRIADSVINGNLWGARCVYSTVTMEDCLIENNLINGLNFRGSEVSLRRNLVRNNRKGIYLQASRAVVVHNRIEGNSEHGILLEKTSGVVNANLITGQGRAGVKVVNSTAVLSENAMISNGEYALINEGSDSFSAQHNWWGNVEPASIELLIRDRNDRPAVGSVDVSLPLNIHPEITFER